MAALLTLALVKTQLGLESDDDTYDEAITKNLPLVTEWFEAYCDRGLAERSITDEEIFFNDQRLVYVWCFPLTTLTSVNVDGVVVDGASYVVNKKDGYFFGGASRPYAEVADKIVLSYVGGYAAADVPPDLAKAFATAVGVQAAVAGVSASGGSGGSAIKSIGLGGGALSVAFDTGTLVGGISGSFDVANVPTEVQNYASVLNRYMRQRV